MTTYYIPHLLSFVTFIKISRESIPERIFFTELSSVALKTIIQYIKMQGKVGYC